MAVILILVIVGAVGIGLVQTRSTLATAATTSITITKYAGDRVTVLSQVTVNASDLETGQVTINGATYQCPVQGDGTTHYFTQGPTLDPTNLWDPGLTETASIDDKGALKGTALSDLCNLVGGANPGDLIQVGAADGYGNDKFPYANVYNTLSDTLNAEQGKMVICWYDFDVDVPSYSNGMLLAFFPTNPVTTGPCAGDYIFGNQAMKDCLPQTDWHFSYNNSVQYPSADGLSVKWVNTINIYEGNAGDWTVGLYGARNDTLTKTWFEDGIDCHTPSSNPLAFTYTDNSGNVWSGLPLWYVCGIVDDTATIHGPGAFNTSLYYDVKVTGTDGSSYTFPSTTIAENNDYILANEENGQALAADKYPLKLVSKDFTVGGPSISQITSISLLNISTSPPGTLPPPSTLQDWPLQLVGACDLTMSEADFAQDVSSNGATTWTDANGDTYSGLPLWMLVAKVDDDITDGPNSFNDALAAAGYQIVVTAADGYYQYFDSATVARNDNIIMANQVELAGTTTFVDLPLTMTGGTPPSLHPAYPLKIVGSATSSGDRVGAVVQIALVFSTTTTSAPAWDLNNDHVCNIGDVVVIGLQWGETGTDGWIPEDLNDDGVINIGDVVVIGLHWGQTW